MSNKTKAIIAVVAAVAVVAVALAFFVFKPAQQPAQEAIPSLSVDSQPTTQDAIAEQRASSSSSSSSAAEPEPAHEPSAELLDYSEALGTGNTVLDVLGDDAVPLTDAVRDRALSVLSAGIAEFRALPYHTQVSDDVDAVIAKYFYSYPNIAYYVYNYTCEEKGDLDPGSLALFTDGKLSSGMYKAAFTLVDAAGQPMAYVDGYYDDGMAMFKFSDISMAGEQG